jgi:hypothetical protein
MPGKADSSSIYADFMTPFKLLRQGINTVGNQAVYGESDPSAIAEYIIMHKSISALEHNTISLVFKKVTPFLGNDVPFQVNLYCTILDNNSPLNGQTFLVAIEPSASPDKIITFRKLYAGNYKILLTNVAGGNYDLYESHSGYNTSGNANMQIL